MKSDPNLWHWLLSEPGKAALAGALGGVVRWITLRDNWKEGAPALVLGAIAAVYLGPLVEPVIATPVSTVAPEADTKSLAAFLTGVGGVGVVGMALDLVRWRKPEGGNDA